ncbi:unnamed protein product, partial [Hapterophycus canaliculatus]
KSHPSKLTRAATSRLSPVLHACCSGLDGVAGLGAVGVFRRPAAAADPI